MMGIAMLNPSYGAPKGKASRLKPLPQGAEVIRLGLSIAAKD